MYLPDWDVEFDLECGIESSDQGEIRDVLRTIPCSGDPSSPGHWPDNLREVSVLRRLAGGRSGSEVVELQLLLSDGDSHLQVAKLSTYAEAVKEYRAAASVAKPGRFAMHLSIVAASRGVLESSETAPHRQGRQAVVYQHLDDRHGSRGKTQALEEVIAHGVADEAHMEAACTSLRQVMQDLADQFHRPLQSDSLSLASFNRTLGTDLHLQFERVKPHEDDVHLDLGISAPSRDEVEAERCHSDEVLLNASSPPGAGRTMTAGRRVTLAIDEPTLHHDKVTGCVGGARVEAVARGNALKRDLKAELGGSDQLQVSANVVHTRAELRSRLLNTALAEWGDVQESEHQLACGNVSVAHPLRSLYSVLRAGKETRVVGPVHGDLNPRNVLVRDGRTYLIDFASALPAGQTLTDYAWLEVCSLRELEGADMTWGDLVRLQRQLAVLSKLAVFIDSECLDKIIGAVVDTCQPRLGRCLALLWEIRRAALAAEGMHCSPQDAQRHLFEHLTLAALRPLKFAEGEQTPHRVAVCAATAGVAAEALEERPSFLFEAWEPGQITTFIQALVDCGQAHRPGAVDLLISAREVSWTAGARRTPADSHLVQVVLRGPLQQHLSKQRDERPPMAPFITLTGRVLRPGEPLVQQGEGALAMGPSTALELLWATQRCVVVADCGAGKTATLRELQARLLRGGVEPKHQSEDDLPPCWPVELSALRISEYLRTGRTPPAQTAQGVSESPTEPRAEQLVRNCADLDDIAEPVVALMLRLGAVLLVVDDLHKVDPSEKPYVLAWIKRCSDEHPAARITLCQRAGDYQPDVLGWPAVALHKVRAHQAREYIEDRLREKDQSSWRSRVKVLYQAIFTEAEAGGLRDLATKPLFLSIMVDHYLKEHTFSTTNPGKLVEEYTRGLIKGADDTEIERRMKLMAHLAGDMDELGAAIRYDDAVKSLERLKPPNARETLEALLRTTAIVTDPSRRWVTFANPIIHAYFAATLLALDEDADKVADRILQFHWREAAQLLVANPQTPEHTVRNILQTALEANLVYGAWLLQAAPPNRFSDLRERLLATLTTQMEAADSGQPAWRQAALGLAKYGTPHALQALKATAMRGCQAPGAAEALDGLVMMHQWFVPEADQVLADVLTSLLDSQPDELDEDLTVRAVRSIATTRLHRLVGYVWDRIRADTPWPIMRQAWKALVKMEIRPSAALRRTYVEACERRLPQTMEELTGSADATTVHQLHLEQREILTVLADEGDLPALLGYRFRTGLADDASWHQMLTTAAQRRGAGDNLACLLHPEAAASDWLHLLDAEDDSTVLLACHMLLHQGQTLPVTQMQQLAATASPARLLALAAFVHTLNGDEMSAVDSIVVSYARRLDEGYLEPLSALVGAVSNHDLEARPKAALLIDEATRKPGLEPSLCWPWATAWRDSVPDRSEIELFVPHLNDSEILKLLSTTDVLLDAPPFDPVPLSDDRRDRLEQLQPADLTSLDAHRFIMMAASTGLHRTLSFVREAAQQPANQAPSNIVLHSHPLHGVVSIVPAAHAVAAIGYLSLLAAKEHSSAGHVAFTAYKELTRMIATLDGAEPSLKRARLVGMGFLGDWMEILESLEPEDPVMHHAARNIVMHWVPGPCSPHTNEKNHLVGVARWISERLQHPGVPSPTRAALVHIRDSAETRLRRYVR
ncbi:hypothetical protein OG416_36730 (plasmid) [Streptomyces longwoodensis]|uniref:hypothetical protein n=1 Tax=Streptomyces longwoodensis TaxID=68231 RepID=UPI002F913BFC|nr:hypothetical protein OG416_36730 [Streptomyces longwoodensis]